MRFLVRCSLALIVIQFAAMLAVAQSAQVTGRIVDNSGGSVPDVMLSIINVDTGVTRDSVTNEQLACPRCALG